ncbi:Transcription factor [Niveomyces insectorum RCEF 264]|uniref:Transcription factor n=1 Tax=Niveomyces insectorum RCEF 264 TaxID=1081102 RepID=A0A167RX16_9HYPO|nr:Transcription factor [Niveomyces insectorum RCEF 264]
MIPRRMTSGHTVKRQRLRERTALACDFCKLKKLKSPKCQNCVKADRNCLVEDPTTGLHRPRDYIQSLEARVAYLEELLRNSRPDVALDHLAGNNNNNDALSSPIILDQTVADFFSPISPQQQAGEAITQTSPPGGGDTGIRPADGPHAAPRAQTSEVGDNSEIDVLSSEVAFLCLSAAGREPHYFGPSSAVSFSRIAGATMGLGHVGGGKSQLGAPNGSEERDLTLVDYYDLQEQFPSPDAAKRMSQAYWNNVHGQYPFLHRPTVDASEQACLAASLQGSLHKANGTVVFFVLMVYAIGSLTLGQGEYERAETYYSLALDYLPSVLETDSLESIQSLLCCAVYSIRSPIGASLWQISGLAIRRCVELGYHRSVEKYRSAAGPLAKEMSKRCFWVAYDIDRVVSFILGRPVAIPDGAIDVEFPLDLDDEYITPTGLLRAARNPGTEPPTHITGAIHAVKLRQLWSKFSDTLYPITFQTHHTYDEATVQALRRELEDWRLTCPDRLGCPELQSLSVWASEEWFQVAYNHSVLLLYRHHITRPIGSDENMEKVIEECYVHAREICLAYRRIYQKQSIQFTWGSVHILFLGGLTYLYCLWRSKALREKIRQGDVANTCMACNTVLIIVAERWNLATTYRDIFETLSQRTIDMVCGGTAVSAGPVPQDAWRTGILPTGSAATGAAVFPENAIGGTEEAQAESLQDWLTGIDSMGVPQESAWLVQELLQGVRDFYPESSVDLINRQPI